MSNDAARKDIFHAGQPRNARLDRRVENFERLAFGDNAPALEDQYPFAKRHRLFATVCDIDYRQAQLAVERLQVADDGKLGRFING